LPVMLLFDVASPYISLIMRGDASLARRSAVSHDGSWIRVVQGDSERFPTSENQF